ncbi:MAG: hypothetical protein WCG10_06420, partial [Chlamydiota bacterium]
DPKEDQLVADYRSRQDLGSLQSSTVVSKNDSSDRLDIFDGIDPKEDQLVADYRSRQDLGSSQTNPTKIEIQSIHTIANATVDDSLTHPQQWSIWSSLKSQAASWTDFSVRDTMSRYAEGVGEVVQRSYASITQSISDRFNQVQDDMSEAWDADAGTFIASTLLVAGLVCAAWNKTEIKEIKPINKDQHIYELVLRANSKRAQLQKKSKKVKRLAVKSLQKAPKASGKLALQKVSKALAPAHPGILSLL